jgi:hypothetical protein
MDLGTVHIALRREPFGRQRDAIGQLAHRIGHARDNRAIARYIYLVDMYYRKIPASQIKEVDPRLDAVVSSASRARIRNQQSRME